MHIVLHDIWPGQQESLGPFCFKLHLQEVYPFLWPNYPAWLFPNSISFYFNLLKYTPFFCNGVPLAAAVPELSFFIVVDGTQ